MSWQPVLCRNTRLCSVCGILLNKQGPAVCSSFCSIWSQYVAPCCLGPEVTGVQGSRARSPSRRRGADGEVCFQPELLSQHHPASSGWTSRSDSFSKSRVALLSRAETWALSPFLAAVQSLPVWSEPTQPCIAVFGTAMSACGTSPKQEHFCVFRFSHSS